MDIEGGEIPWIESLSDTQMNKFSQIVMEFHAPFTEFEKYTFDKINKNHILVHFHANNCCGVINYKGVLMPRTFECTYIHKKYYPFPPILNTDLIPSPIDMRNVFNNNEIYLNYPPFVNNNNQHIIKQNFSSIYSKKY
jgi:hypothetical protein